MKSSVILLVLGTSCGAFSDSYAQQNRPDDDPPAVSERPRPFSQVVGEYFAQWDRNSDGTLSKEEIEASVGNPKFHAEAAAAIAAIEKVVRGNKYTLPPITKHYLVSSPLHERLDSDEHLNSADDVSKPEKFDYAPAFQPRYAKALMKLRNTSRELFPQDLPTFNATHQGALGDCPFISTVGAMVYRDPAAVKAMFTQNAKGSITVSFGDGRSIRIDRLTDADAAIWSSAGANGLWLTALEKAYRRVLLRTHRSEQPAATSIYDKFASSRTIEILDGHQTRRVPLRQIKPGSAQLAALRKDLAAAQREHRLVKTGTGASRKKVPGIPHGHAFAILGYDKEADLVHIWNPWGNNFTPKGPEGPTNGYTTKTGQFDAPLKEMLEIFDDVIFEMPAVNRD